MDGPAKANVRFSNVVLYHGTISDNFEGECIPSLRVKDGDGMIRSVMYLGRDHTSHKLL